MTLSDLITPALLLDIDRVRRNCDRLLCRAAELGVSLRPHMKTAKSADVARLATRERSSGITVSTLAEVDYFARAGFKDLTYAVGIDPAKIPALTELKERHRICLNLLTDSADAVRAVVQRCRPGGPTFGMFIEIDCGAGRGGVLPDSAELLEIAEAIETSHGVTLRGVLTHAGHSYSVQGCDAIAEIAEEERLAAVSAAGRLRSSGFSIDCVSVGSTPTALCARSLDGVSEIRPGVYMLFDLDQVQLGVCGIDDIAASVLCTVIGHNRRSERLLVDAGALALSKDLSADKLTSGIGYGLVCGADSNTPIAGMHVAEVHQEHGFVAYNVSPEEAASKWPIGSRLRVLPNHACMTAGAYDRYHLISDGRFSGVWEKAWGWV